MTGPGFRRDREQAHAAEPVQRVRVDPDRRVIPARQLETLWRRDDIALRDKAFWRLAYDSAARAGELLGLDLADLDLDAKTAVVAGKGGIPRQVNWYTHTAHLLARLTSGRTDGPLFLASRRPRAPVATADGDPATGEHVVVDDLGPPAVVAVGAATFWLSRVFSRM